jgi:two-component system OmpR family response regulator
MSSDGRRVLLIEDDAAVASGIVRGLKRAGFEVELAVDGVSGARQALSEGVALVILDLMLPGRDGFEVLQAIRARCAAPVIVVTARVELEDRLKAFELGAVDYLPKPFFHEELLARIQARLGLSRTRSRIIEAPGARIDIDGRQVEIGGERVRLTPTEFALLRYLSERPGRAISRLDLATALEDLDEADPQNVHAHISRLRRKLGPAGALIVTVWGHGYRFEPAGSGGAS